MKQIKEYSTRYAKNVGESLYHSAQNRAESKYGNLYKVAKWTQSQLNQEVLRDSRTLNSSSIKNSLKNLSIFKDANTILNNSVSDLKTGKFYNKAREDELMEKEYSGMFGDDGEFGFGDDDSDSSMNDIENSAFSDLNKDLNAGFAASSATISNSVMSGSAYVGETVKASSKLQYTQLVQMQQINKAGFEGVNTHLKAIIDFNQSALKQHIDNSTKFYETTTNYLAEQNAIMKEMIEIQREMYKNSNPQVKKNSSFSNVFGGGGFNLGNYKEHVKKNWENSTIGSMIQMMKETGGDPTAMFASPLSFISDGLLSTLMGPQLSKSLGRLNRTVGNAGVMGLHKLGKQQGFLGSFLNEIFGFNGKEVNKVDTKNFVKGPVAYNGIANKTIIEVIPTYLRRIEAALTGEDERVFDINTGRWTTVKNAQKNYNSERRASIKQAAAPMQKHLTGIASRMKFNDDADQVNFYSDMGRVLEALVDSNGDYNFEFVGGKLKNARAYMTAYGVSSERNMTLIAKMLSTANGNTRAKLVSNSYQYKENRNNYMSNMGNNAGGIDLMHNNGAFKGSSNVRGIFQRSQDLLENSEVAKAIRGTYMETHLIRTMLENGTGFGGGSPTKARSAHAKSSSNSRAVNNYWNSFTTTAKDARGLHKEQTSATDAGLEVLGLTAEDVRRRNSGKGRVTSSAANVRGVGRLGALLNMQEDGLEFAYDGWGEGLKNKYTNAKGSSFSEKMKNSKGKMDKAGLAIGALLDLRDRPTKILAGMVDAVNGSIESFFFDHEANLKDEHGKPIKGFFNTMSYYARKTFDDFGKFLNENVLGPLNTTVDLIAEHFPTVGKIRDRVKGSVGNIVGSVTSAFGNVFSDIKSKSSGDSGLFGGGRAGGDRYITKTGLYALSKGEAVIPSTMNPFNPNIATASIARDSANEQKVINAAKQYGLGKLSGFASGTKDADKIVDDSPGGKVNDALNRVSSWYDAIVDKMPDNVKAAMENFKKQAPEVFGEGALYGGLSGLMVSGGPMGVLAGGALGAGLIMVKNTERVQEMLYGQLDEQGNRKGGFLDRPEIKKMLGTAKDVKSYGIVGGAIGAATGLGPIPGLLAGSAVAFAKNNQEVRDYLFGAEGKDKTQMQKFLSEHMGRGLAGVGIGGLAGASIAGPFGAVGGALIGGGLSFASTTDKFKEMILGKEDPKNPGKRIGGVLNYLNENVVDPMRERMEGFHDRLEKYMKDRIFNPLERAFKPLKQLVKHGVGDMFDNIADSVKSQFGTNQMKYMAKQLAGSKIGKFGAAAAAAYALGIPAPLIPMVGLTGALVSSGPIQRAISKVISVPGKLASKVMDKVGQYGDKLRVKTIQKGMADDMTAQERMNFMAGQGITDYKYAGFDEKIAGADKDQLEQQLALLQNARGNSRQLKQKRAAMTDKMYEIASRKGVSASVGKAIKKAIQSGDSADLENAVKAIQLSDMPDAMKSQMIKEIRSKIIERQKFDEHAANADKYTSQLSEEMGVDMSDPKNIKRMMEMTKSELEKRDFSKEDEATSPENDPTTVTNIALDNINKAMLINNQLIAAFVSGKKLTEDEIKNITKQTNGMGADKLASANADISSTNAMAKSAYESGVAAVAAGTAAADVQRDSDIAGFVATAGLSLSDLSNKDKQRIRKFIKANYGVNDIKRMLNKGQIPSGNKEALFAAIKVTGANAKLMQKVAKQSGTPLTTKDITGIGNMKSNVDYATQLVSMGMQLDNRSAVEAYDNGKFTRVKKCFKQFLDFGYAITQSGIELLIDLPNFHEIVKAAERDDKQYVSSMFEQYGITYKSVPRGGSFLRRLKNTITKYASKASSALHNGISKAAGLAKSGISNLIDSGKKKFNQFKEAMSDDGDATIQKHALGIGKVLKGGLSALSKGEAVISAANNTFGITDKLKSLGSLAGKALKAGANFLAPGATATVAGAYDAIKNLSSKSKIDNGGGEISAKLDEKGKKKNIETVPTKYGIQTYKLNTNGTMSLDDTAENKDISKKLREEDTDRQESKEYLRIIAENTKALGHAGGLLGGGPGMDAKDAAKGGLLGALAGTIGNLFNRDKDKTKDKNPTKTDPVPDKPGKQATLTERVGKWFGDKWAKFKDTRVGKTVLAGWEKGKAAYSWGADKASKIYNKAASLIAPEYYKYKTGFNMLGDSISEKTGKVTSWVSEKAGAIADTAKAAANKVASKVSGITSAVGDAADGIGAKVQEGLSVIKDTLKKIMDKASTFIPGKLSDKANKFCSTLIEKISSPAVLKKAAGKAAKQIAAIATGPLGAVIAVGSIAYAFYDGWSSAGSYFQLQEGQEPTTGQKIVAGVTNALAITIPFLGWFIDGGDIIAIGKMIFGDNDPASGIADSIQNEIDYVSNGVKNNVDWIKNGISNNLQYLGNKASGVGGAIKNEVDYVSNGIANNFQYVTDKATELGSSLYQGIGDTATAVSDTVKQTVTDAQKAISDTVNAGLKIGQESLTNAWNSAGEIAKGLYKSASDLWQKFVSKLPSLKDIKAGAKTLFDKGKSLFQSATSIGQSVANAASSAWDTVTTGASNLVTSAKNFVFGQGKYGRSKYGRGGVLSDGDFASQLDPGNQMSYNASYDTENQTMADSGCGPGAASNAIAALGGSVPITAAATYALNNGYKEKDGGTKPGFFGSLFKQLGANSSDISNNNQAIVSNLKKGYPVVLMGQDNAVSDNNPYGPGPHYVTATGFDDQGNIIIQDSESDGPNKVYKTTDVLNKSSIAIAAKPKVRPQSQIKADADVKSKYGRGKWGRYKGLIRRVPMWGMGKAFIPRWGRGKFGRGAGGAGPQLLQMLMQLGFNKIASCGILGNMMQESRLTPNIVEGGGTAPEISVNGSTGYGLCQWTDAGRQQGLVDFAKANGKSTSDPGVQCSYIAQECNNMGLTNQLNNCSSASDAAFLFHKDYEISADSRDAIQQRLDWAEEAYANDGAIAGSNGNVSSGGVVGTSSKGGTNSQATSLFGIFDQLNDELDNALNSFGLGKYGRSKYGRGIFDTLNAVKTRFSAAMGPIGGAFKALSNSPIGQKLSSIFGSNPFSDIIGAVKDKVTGGGGGNSGAGMSSNPNIQQAINWARTRENGPGYGDTGCTAWANDFLNHANINPINTWVPDAMKEAQQAGLWKSPDQGAVAGDIGLVDTDGSMDEPDHAIVMDGQGGMWSNSSSRNIVFHADTAGTWGADKVWGYIGTGGAGQGNVAQGAQTTSAAETAAMAGSTSQHGQGKYGRGKFGRSKLGRHGYFGRSKVLDSIQANNNAANSYIDGSSSNYQEINAPIVPVVQQNTAVTSSSEQKVDTMISLLSSINNNIAIMVQGISAIAQAANGGTPVAQTAVVAPVAQAAGMSDTFDRNSMVQIVSDMLKIAKK